MRLLTRGDFDGLACAVLLTEIGVVDDYKLVHPKDVQDGKVNVTSNDVLANVPFADGCGLWFDHHLSEEERLNLNGEFNGATKNEPSAARVIWDYYGGDERFGESFQPLINAVDKADSGAFTKEEILNPKGWVLLSFIMDPRSGLGRYHDYRISNYDLMMEMINFCCKMSIVEILEQPDVKERVNRYFQQEMLFEGMLQKNTRTDENVIVTDLRGADEIFTGNRFVIYALYPEQNVSIWIIDGKEKQNAVFAVGHSITNRTCASNIGSMMLSYGGGGHYKVGTCQVPYEEADNTLAEMIAALKTAG